MMKMMFIGNLVADPTLREVVIPSTGETVKVCTFRVACNKTRNGKVDYVNVSVWREYAVTCHANLYKGRTVYVEGEPRATAGVGRTNGQMYANLECNAQSVQFIGANKMRQQTADAGTFDESQVVPAVQPAPVQPTAPAAPAAPVAPVQHRRTPQTPAALVTPAALTPGEADALAQNWDAIDESCLPF